MGMWCLIRTPFDIGVNVAEEWRYRWRCEPSNQSRMDQVAQASGVLCDERVPQKLEDMFYRTAIRPTMLYDAECWLTKRQHVQQLCVTEMRMLRWMCGHSRKDRVWNDDIQDRVGVAPIEEKLIQHCRRWFEYIMPRQTKLDMERVRKKRSECHQTTNH